MGRSAIASRQAPRSGRPLVGLGVAAFLIAIVGCSRETGAPVSTWPNEASATPAACMAAQLRGELIQGENSTILLVDDGGVVHTIVWPEGYVIDETKTAIIDE